MESESYSYQYLGLYGAIHVDGSELLYVYIVTSFFALVLVPPDRHVHICDMTVPIPGIGDFVSMHHLMYHNISYIWSTNMVVFEEGPNLPLLV